MANGYSPSISSSSSVSSSPSVSISPEEHGEYLQPATEDIHFSLNMNKAQKDHELKLKASISIPINNIINAGDEYKILIDAYLDVAKQRIQNEITSKLIIK